MRFYWTFCLVCGGSTGQFAWCVDGVQHVNHIPDWFPCSLWERSTGGFTAVTQCYLSIWCNHREEPSTSRGNVDISHTTTFYCPPNRTHLYTREIKQEVTISTASMSQRPLYSNSARSYDGRSKVRCRDVHLDLSSDVGEFSDQTKISCLVLNCQKLP